MNPYHVLGLPTNASKREVVEAYRQRVESAEPKVKKVLDLAVKTIRAKQPTVPYDQWPSKVPAYQERDWSYRFFEGSPWADHGLSEGVTRKDVCVNCNGIQTFKSISPDQERCGSCNESYPRSDTNAHYLSKLFKTEVNEAEAEEQPPQDDSPIYCLTCQNQVGSFNAMQPFCSQKCLQLLWKTTDDNIPEPTPSSSELAIPYVTPKGQERQRLPMSEWEFEHASAEYLLEVTGDREDYSSAMYDLWGDHKATFRKIQESHDRKDLHSKGMPAVGHITVANGLRDHRRESVEKAMKGEQVFDATVGAYDVFHHSGGYDVLVMKVNSKDLHRHNKKIKAAAGGVDFGGGSDGKYNPHITVGYFKKGTVDHLVGKTHPLHGKKIKFHRLTHFHAPTREYSPVHLS
jgi:2'-5' RNA ligase/endogenous inhibitor of DNA gyrase (YacG/DUF329 family)